MLSGEDRVVLDLLRLNRWRRPVCLALTVTRDHVPWLWPYARLEGLAERIVPFADPGVWDVARLRHALIDVARYEGVADTTIAIDSDTRAMCGNYVFALHQLALAQLGRGDPDGCLATLHLVDERVPLRRLGQEVDPFGPLREEARARIHAASVASRPGPSARE